MYKEYLPCHILAPYVDRYWEFKGQTEQGMQIKLGNYIQSYSLKPLKSYKFSN